MNGTQGSDGGEVIRSDDGSRRLLEAEEISHGGYAALDAVIALFDQFRSRRDTARLHARDEGVEAAAGGLKIQRARNESDAAVIQGEKVLQSFLNTLTVIDNNICGARRVGSGVHEHHGDVAARKLSEERRISFGSHDSGAVDFAFEHAANTLGHAFGAVVGVGDDDLEAFLDGLIFEVFDEFGEEGIGYIRNDEPQHAAAAGNKSPRVSVRVEIKLFDRFLDALCGARADFVGTVDGAGDGCRGDFGEFGDLFDVHSGSVSQFLWEEHESESELREHLIANGGNTTGEEKRVWRL